MTPIDFITALEDFDTFLVTPITEVEDSGYDYPIGRGYKGVLLHFVHYKTFQEAIGKWEERKARINMENLGVMLTNWGGYDITQLDRFDRLPFKHKVVFTDQEFRLLRVRII